MPLELHVSRPTDARGPRMRDGQEVSPYCLFCYLRLSRLIARTLCLDVMPRCVEKPCLLRTSIGRFLAFLVRFLVRGEKPGGYEADIRHLPGAPPACMHPLVFWHDQIPQNNNDEAACHNDWVPYCSSEEHCGEHNQHSARLQYPPQGGLLCRSRRRIRNAWFSFERQ